MIWPILETRAGIQKYFRSFFGSNENIQKSFWNFWPSMSLWRNCPNSTFDSNAWIDLFLFYICIMCKYLWICKKKKLACGKSFHHNNPEMMNIFFFAGNSYVWFTYNYPLFFYQSVKYLKIDTLFVSRSEYPEEKPFLLFGWIGLAS